MDLKHAMFYANEVALTIGAGGRKDESSKQ